MADLVETVAREIAEYCVPDNMVLSDNLTAEYLDQGLTDFGVVARAAIAAQLDDMAEPSEGMLQAARRTGVGGKVAADIWATMLAQYRKEMLG